MAPRRGSPARSGDNRRHGRPVRVALPARGRSRAAARRLDPPHDAAAPGRAAGGVVLVHGLGRGRRPAGRREGHRAACGDGGRSRDGAVRGARARAGELDARRRARRRRRCATSPTSACTPPRCRARSWRARRPSARISGTRHRRGPHARARRLARHDRPQLGRAARGDVAVAARHRLRRARPAPGSTSPSAASAIAGRTTPWIANGALELDGERHVLGGMRARGGGRRRARRRRRSSLGDTRIAGHRPARPDRRLGLRRPARRRAPCPELLHRPHRGRRTRGRTLVSAHGGVYELGTRDRGHGIPVAPFPDP